MSKKLVFLMMALLLLGNAASAQNDPPARLRMMQLSFVPPSNAVIDVQIDGTVVFEGIGFPFATDYLDVIPGNHTLTTTIVDPTNAAASTSLTLQAGHRYSVVVSGDYTDLITFITIDETDSLPAATGSTAAIVNLTGQPIEDITLDGEPALDDIPVNGYGFVRLPETEFVMGGRLDDQSYSETFNPHTNTHFLIAVRLLPTGEPQIIYHRSSQLSIAGYLQSVAGGAQFSQIAERITRTDFLDSVSDDREYTLFLPVNQAIDRFLSAGTAIDDGQLRELLSIHIVAQNLPPYVLPGHETLATLAGSTVSLNFGATASGFWEIEGTPILWDVRLANGVIYGIDGVINPSE